MDNKKWSWEGLIEIKHKVNTKDKMPSSKYSNYYAQHAANIWKESWNRSWADSPHRKTTEDLWNQIRKDFDRFKKKQG